MEEHSFTERNRLFFDHAVNLLAEAAQQCLARAGLVPGDIDAIVSVSTSDIATPSLEARLMEVLPFSRDATRLPVFGLGCAGGVPGPARAAVMARAESGSRVLFLCVKLCGLTFRRGETRAG